MSIFKIKFCPTIEKVVSTKLTLSIVHISIDLQRKSYEATLFYTNKPNDRYDDYAVKEKVVVKGSSATDILDQIRRILR